MDTLRYCLIGVLAAFSVTSTNAAAATSETNPVRTQPPAEYQSSTQRVLVKLRSTATTTRLQAQSATNTIQALATRSNLTLMQSRQITAGLHVMQVVSAQGDTIAATLARLRADSAVEYAELDQRRYPHAVPNDPLYLNQRRHDSLSLGAGHSHGSGECFGVSGRSQCASRRHTVVCGNRNE